MMSMSPFVSSVALLVSFTIASSAATSRQHEQHAAGTAAGLVKEVQEATKSFHDVNRALSAGYAAFLGCVSGPEEGAMGVHFVNSKLVEDGQLDPARPEALLYEPKDGRLQLLGVEFLVLAKAWDAANKTPPSLVGQAFHYTGSPNRYGLPPFYALHVWAWRQNPRGTFADWNPRVSCAEYAGNGQASLFRPSEGPVARLHGKEGR